MFNPTVKPKRLKHAPPVFLSLLATCLLATAASQGAPVNTKLNGPLVNGGNVERFKVSPDGLWVVYLADQETDGAVDLYSVPIEGGPPTRLSAALPSGSQVIAFEITPDSRRVLYIAPQESVGKFELYSVPIEGPSGAGVKINQELQADGNVTAIDLAISPDSNWVFFLADWQIDHQKELFRAPTDGSSSPTRVNPPLPADSYGVISFRLSPTGDQIVYYGDPEGKQQYDLLSAPLAGPSTSSVLLYTPPAPGAFGIPRFEISPDGSQVVYTADQQVQAQPELYSVPIGGPESAGVKLNGPLGPGGYVDAFLISPDSSRIVYLADQENDNMFTLFSVPIAGPAGDGVQLSGPMVSGRTVVMDSFSISAESNYVIYVADQETNDKYELFSVPIAGPLGSSVRLSLSLTSSGSLGDGTISPDGRRVVYTAQRDALVDNELYSVPIDGPGTASIRLSRPLGMSGNLGGFRISPDGRQVAYRTNVFRFAVGDNPQQLYGVPIGGPSESSALLNLWMVENGDVSDSFEFTPDSRRVVYIADQDSDEVDELYVSYDRPAAARGWTGYR